MKKRKTVDILDEEGNIIGEETIVDCESAEEWKRWNDFADALDELGDQMTCPDDIELDE
mgnify:CR=1 FL=1